MVSVSGLSISQNLLLTFVSVMVTLLERGSERDEAYTYDQMELRFSNR